MKKLTDIRGLEVVNEDGERLGHVWDIRCDAHRIDPGDCSIAGFFVGRSGLLERFGLAPRNLRRIEWAAVVQIEPHQLIVRGVRKKND